MPTTTKTTKKAKNTTTTMIGAITHALDISMAADDNVVLLGEDVGKRGGVFLATEGLQAKYGAERVIDTPLCEAAIIGAAVGMAVHGMRPVAEIQFADYIFPGIDQLFSQAANLRYRTGGTLHAPMVVRMPGGGGVKGGHHHSQSPEAHFVHAGGLKVVYPYDATDAFGLMNQAIDDDDPVVFLEPKRLYRAAESKSTLPSERTTIPFGQAIKRQQGDDVVLISYGGTVSETLKAAKALAEQGIHAEVIDLRTLVPWDEQTVLESVARVGRCVLISEANRSGSFMSEVSAVICEDILDSLEAPPLRVTGMDMAYPYAQEKLYMPGVNRILQAVQQVLDY